MVSINKLKSIKQMMIWFIKEAKLSKQIYVIKEQNND